MANTNKRVLTDEIRENLASSNASALSTGVPDDLAHRLRNVGARVRKTVTEGYQSAPSSTFTRAQSTGTIFRSMNDTLQDVHSNPLIFTSNESNATRTRKRPRSLERDGRDTTVDDEMSLDEQRPGEPLGILPIMGVENKITPRPIKPLRHTRHGFRETRSLPANSFSFAEAKRLNLSGGKSDVVEEEDWSYEGSFQSTEPSFEPMFL